MQTRIRLIKRSDVRPTEALAASETEITDQQRDREMATTVKGWIAEWRARNEALRIAAALLARSLEDTAQINTVG